MQVDISKRLNSLRTEREMQYQQLAEEIEKVWGRKYAIKHPASRLKAIESGRRRPTMPELVALSIIFDISIKYLVGETDIRK